MTRIKESRASDVAQLSGPNGIDRPATTRNIANRSRLTDWIACVVLVLASLGLGLVHVPAHKSVSPIDEYVYIDYLAKVPTQLFVHEGEETGEYARHYLACHGVRTIGYYPAKMCKHTKASGDSPFPNKGYTSADLYTPLYFGATWLMAQPLQFFGVHDLVTAGRYTGVTWLAAAAVLMYLALRRLKIPWEVSAGAALLLVGSLPAYWSNTYISTDATALFAGSLMFFGLALLQQRARGATWLFVVFAVIASLLKLQNLMAVAAAALVLLIQGFLRATATEGSVRRRVGRFFKHPLVLAAIAAVAGGVAAQGVWVVIRKLSAVGPFPDQGVSRPFGKTEAIQEALKFFPGVSIGALNPSDFGLQAVIASTLLAWVIVAGVLGLLALSHRGSIAETLAGASLVVALLAGPVLAVANIAVSGYYFALPARYGMALLPFFVACGAFLSAKKAWFGYSLPLTAVICYVAVMVMPEG